MIAKSNIKKETEIDKKEYDTQLAIHSVQNLLGNKNQHELFDKKSQKLHDEKGLKLDGSIDRFGVKLSDIESRVVEGVMKGFTSTNYKGNMAPKEVEEFANEKYAGKVPKSYQYIKELPRLRVTQNDILGWCNLKKDSFAHRQRIVTALNSLGSTQFCFYYDRLAFDENEKPLKDSKGKWKKESITVVDTLFTIKQVKHTGSDKLNYYEITPSSIFLDQRENYFIMMRNNWRAEVVKLVGNKKASSYTFRFLMFLVCQYELKRRSSSTQKPYQISWSAEEVAIAIKMPPSIYKKNKKRMNQILDDAYSVALSVGYLESFERGEYADLLMFNDKKYYDPTAAVLNEAVKTMAGNKSRPSKIEKYLFEVFHKVKAEIDSGHKPPSGELLEKELLLIKSILKNRSAQDVERLITWGMKKPFWCTQVNTVEKLKRNFNNAWMEMSANKKLESPTENKDWSLGLKIRLDLMRLGEQVRFEVLNNDLEISINGHPSSQCFLYNDKDFKKKVSSYLKNLSKHFSYDFDEILGV